MTIFASLRQGLPEVDEADLRVGFGGACDDGQSGYPMTAPYLNAVLAWFCRCLVPQGGIILWSGANTAVPTGWAICDGSNGTPDLSSKFVIGATVDVGANPVGSSGGSNSGTTASAGEHNHGGTTEDHRLTIAQMPRHSHNLRAEHQTVPIQFDTGDNDQISTRADDISTDEAGGGDPHSHEISDSGAHTHTFTYTPPYCALFYIMKL